MLVPNMMMVTYMVNQELMGELSHFIQNTEQRTEESTDGRHVQLQSPFTHCTRIDGKGIISHFQFQLSTKNEAVSPH